VSDDKDGMYCSICGGVRPDRITTKQILVDGKETGIEKLDAIIAEVGALRLSGDGAIAGALLARVHKENYVPTKKADAYAAALLAEYKKAVKQ